MLKIHGKTVEHRVKNKRFPDETLESENGRMRIDRYMKAGHLAYLILNVKTCQ